jgi:steroid 5-alpha reductase family enzyme
MLATTRVTLAPVSSSVAQRKHAGRARVASPKRPAGLIGALRNRAFDTSKPRRAHRAVVVRAASVNPALGDIAAKAAKAVKAAPAAKAAMAIPSLATVLGTAYSFPFLWALAIVPCMLGLVNPVYVFSVGYGLSVAAQGIGLLAAASASGVWISNLCLAHLLGAVFYGVRLGAFLYWRSVTWTEWGQRAKNAPEAKPMPPPARLMVILTCALLYAFMCSPMLWHVQTANVLPASQNVVVVVGLVVQWLGAVLEAVADQQKSDYKRSEAGTSRWCDVGVWARCRHANYLGEVMFWVGAFVAGVPGMLASGLITFVPAIVGVGFIVKLMTSQCVKQDEKQLGRYGDDAEYKAWVQNSGSLFPKLA